MRYVVGNWKMALTIEESCKLALALKKTLPVCKNTEAWIAPGAAALDRISKALIGSNIRLGAQNAFSPKGAFTGEVSADVLKELGASFSIIGHSERRHVFGESSALSALRAKRLLDEDITVIFCIGETLEERESGNTNKVLEAQLKPLLLDLQGNTFQKLLIAYEPVWAIGTGKVASIKEIEEAHSFIRSALPSGSDIPILYGGSVTPDNFSDIIKVNNVDGALVGGASLDLTKFLKLVSISESCVLT